MAFELSATMGAFVRRKIPVRVRAHLRTWELKTDLRDIRRRLPNAKNHLVGF